MRNAHEIVSAIARATARDRVLIASAGGESMEPGDQLAALVDVARALDAAGIPYALIGGIAVGIQSGAPRATEDVDIAAIGRQAAVAALEAAGFRVTGAFAHSVNFRHANGEPVQVAFDASFEAPIARAEVVEVGGIPIRVLRRDDLIASKQRAAADPSRRRSKALRDQADVELLLGDVPDPDEGW